MTTEILLVLLAGTILLLSYPHIRHGKNEIRFQISTLKNYSFEQYEIQIKFQLHSNTNAISKLF